MVSLIKDNNLNKYGLVIVSQGKSI